MQQAGRRLQSLLRSRGAAKPRPLVPCPAAQANCHLPSRCSSSSGLCGIQFFGVPCHAKRHPRYLQALPHWQEIFQGTPLLYQDSLRTVQMSLSFPFLLACAGGLFSTFRAAKIQVTLHGHILYPSGWSRHGASPQGPEHQRRWTPETGGLPQLDLTHP